MVVEGRSGPKLAVADEAKLDLEASVGVVWKMLVEVGTICGTAVALANDGVACNAAALELAAARE